MKAPRGWRLRPETARKRRPDDIVRGRLVRTERYGYVLQGRSRRKVKP